MQSTACFSLVFVFDKRTNNDDDHSLPGNKISIGMIG